ncbi:hypothetical protein [Phaeodactylibacter xiamenensis]|uniref:hypothetical protein n=1 Tax=Phaeodactylibacter xiamenensis TaxID=1524460 RepID=UPI003CCB90B1
MKNKLSLFLCLLFVLSCQKENLFVNSAKQNKDLPRDIVPYEKGSLNLKEELRNQIALGLGRAISKDKVFKKELFELLTLAEGRSLINIPVLMFLNAQFTSGRGKDILALHLKNDNQVSFRSMGDEIQQMIGDIEPSMTIEIPVFVRSYFLTPETIDIQLSNFAEIPFAVYPETSQANPQGVLVGYGDTTSLHPDGIYGVYPASSYENHIPVHVKRSRSLVLIENGIVNGTGLSENEYVERLFPTIPTLCLDELIDEFSDAPDFLEPGKKYLNVVQLSKNIRKACPPPPSFTEEVCNNGIDDDGDGLVDNEDPDCQENAEICNNGIDDDGDGLTDGEDPDCGLSCPENATFYRDCEVNVNRITGGRFESVNWYTNVINPLLPALESQINLTLNFFRILDIEGCGSSCPLNRAFTNQTESAVSVFIHGDIQTNPLFTDAPVGWADNYEYFEGVFDRDLSSDRISYFLIRAQMADQEVPAGAIPVGGLDNIAFIGLNVDFWATAALRAYVVTSNWVNYATPFTDDLIRSDGISYTRAGNTGPDWNANYIGDIIQIDVAETDLTTVSIEDGVITTNTQSETRTVELTSSIGFTFGAEIEPVSAGTNSSAGYTFTQQGTLTNQVTASTQYTISSERIVQLSSLTLRYQDSADRSQYPKYRALNTINDAHNFGLYEDSSYGHSTEARSTWDRDPFSLASSDDLEEPYQLLGEEGDPMRFINVIRKPDE